MYFTTFILPCRQILSVFGLLEVERTMILRNIFNYLPVHTASSFCSVALHPNSVQGYLIVEVSRPHTHTHTRYDSSERND